MDIFSKDTELLNRARICWHEFGGFRKERNRCKRYCYGDQWGDPLFVDGRWMREENYIRSQGSEPLKNNLIRRLVKQVIGLYRSEDHQLSVDCSDKAVSKLLAGALDDVRRRNLLDELDARALEEFLISGMVVQRKTYGWRNGREGCWTYNVRPDNFFIDSFSSDCRGWDVSCLGEIHDMTFGELCAEFGKNDNDVKALAEIYNPERFSRLSAGGYAGGSYAFSGADAFLQPSNLSLCRVYEVWHRVRTQGYLCHDRDAGRLYWLDACIPPSSGCDLQWGISDEWCYSFLSPFGDVLAEGTTPYWHCQHPYSFKAYPFLDGEIHSFVGDVIDQQRYTNRLITLYDWVMRSSAKGVLIVPEESVPDGYTVDDMAEQWARFNGVIPVKTRNGSAMPHQVAANAANVGINELLQTQLDFMEDISGVTGALQGKSSSSGMSGKLYEQQTHNASLSQLDMLNTFRSFVCDGAYKDVCNILQFRLDAASGCSDDMIADRENLIKTIKIF